ncbi:CbtA family protein [Nitriliruptor alkaliphilus]|uniref:CbtA family protein n=1 Tax=Nitriliruptor alkaliphilus TaxID=427918 RepID=UPI0006983EE9|nr:CbtA family protein [Nitriliruptor alkaliphilus]
MLTEHIRRGLAAGLLAGVLAGVFAFVVGEIPVREAIVLEEAGEAALADHPTAGESDPEAEFPVPRTTQQALLPVATALVGAAFGGLFGLTLHLLRPRLRDPDPWRTPLRLGAVAWLAFVAVPLVVAPPNPPAVGDGDAIAARSGWYLGAIAASLLLSAALWALARRWRPAGWSAGERNVAVGALGVLAFGALIWALPVEAAAGDFPADLLWQFRLAALGTQTLLWVSLAVSFGLLSSRAAERVPA